ncbi:MAG: TRAP transporter substrate-binding protein DctP [Clostridiales bacterium]|nr:TRAP transporter substrate-binding protein DctP [Clostridiales bacterium]
MKKKSLLIAIIAILAMTMTLFAGCGGGSDDGGDGSAAGGESYTIKMGGVDAPDDVSTQTMEKFAELVNEKTGGAVTVEVYPAGQLGNYDEMYQEIKKGNLEAGLFTVYGSDTDPAIEILYLPYAATDMASWKALVEYGGDFWNEIESIHADQGVQLLGLYNNGFLGLAYAKLKETPETGLYDFSQKKDELMRVPGMESMQKSCEGMGYSTTVMAYTDVYTALQTGTVDGSWAGGPTLNYYNFRDVINYFADLKASTDVYCMVMNKELLEGMPEEYQEAIKEAGLEACDYGNDLQEEKDVELLKKMEEEGITVYVPTDEQRAEMQDYFITNVWPQITGPFNQDLVKSISENLGV